MKTKTLFALSFALTCCMLFTQPTSSANNISPLIKAEVSQEEFDPSYFFRFQTIDAVIRDADQKFGKGNQSLDYYNHIAGILRKRFYHGYSHYSFNENALAWFSGLAWNHLSAIVIPDDIMKHPNAACSQQAIVLMEIFKRTNTDFRKVGLEGHFVVEGFIENEWRFFDTNIEPDIMHNRQSLEKMIASKSFEKAYRRTKLTRERINSMIHSHNYGVVNQEPAAKATMFHQLGFWIQSKFYFIVFLLWACSWVYMYTRKNDVMKG